MEAMWNTIKQFSFEMAMKFFPDLQMLVVIALILFLACSGGTMGFIIRFIIKKLM